MSDLALIQDAFSKALLDAGQPPPASIRSPTRRPADRRFAVYRNNVAAGLIAALAARFPVVQRLVGDEFFREMARQYIAHDPPRSPIMMEYGGTFADFIEGFAPAAPVPYLGAIARIEMARGRAYHSADATPFGAEAFARLPADRLEQMSVKLHPSVAIVTSPYPVYSIWKVNQRSASVVPVSPWGPEAVLIARPMYAVEVHQLAAGTARFLSGLLAGQSFADAVSAGADASDQFDTVHSLAFLINARIVVGFGDQIQPILPN